MTVRVFVRTFRDCGRKCGQMQWLVILKMNRSRVLIQSVDSRISTFETCLFVQNTSNLQFTSMRDVINLYIYSYTRQRRFVTNFGTMQLAARSTITTILLNRSTPRNNRCCAAKHHVEAYPTMRRNGNPGTHATIWCAKPEMRRHSTHCGIIPQSTQRKSWNTCLNLMRNSQSCAATIHITA